MSDALSIPMLRLGQRGSVRSELHCYSMEEGLPAYQSARAAQRQRHSSAAMQVSATIVLMATFTSFDVLWSAL